MKVIKLDKRHKYYKHGFQAALRFNSTSDKNIRKIEIYLRDTHGQLPWKEHQQKQHPYLCYLSSRGSWKRKSKVYWICVKNPAVLTMALLAVDLT